MNSESKYAGKVLLGAFAIALVIFVLLRSTHVVGDAMSPTLDDGNLGAPPMAAVGIFEFFISSLAFVGTVLLGVGNWAYGKFRELTNRDKIPVSRAELHPAGFPGNMPQPAPQTAKELIELRNRSRPLPDSERRYWSDVLNMAIRDGDFESTAKAAEVLAGRKYFPRKPSSPQPESNEADE